MITSSLYTWGNYLVSRVTLKSFLPFLFFPTKYSSWSHCVITTDRAVLVHTGTWLVFTAEREIRSKPGDRNHKTRGETKEGCERRIKREILEVGKTEERKIRYRNTKTSQWSRVLHRHTNDNPIYSLNRSILIITFPEIWANEVSMWRQWSLHLMKDIILYQLIN